MTKKKLNTYTPEFKESAIKLALDSDESSWVNLRTCFFNRFISFSFDSLLATLVLPLGFEAL
jgi:hypothetical protein